MPDTTGTTVTPTTTKPGYKTTEFYLTLIATVGGIIMSSGAIGDTTLVGKLVGAVLALLSTMGYTYHRTQLKSGE
jgi:hypothetical protein